MIHKRSASLQNADFQLPTVVDHKHYLASDHFAVNDDEFIYIDSCLAADENDNDPGYSLVTALNCDQHSNAIKHHDDRGSFVLRLQPCHRHQPPPSHQNSITNGHCHTHRCHNNNNNSEYATNNNIDHAAKNTDQLIIENDPDSGVDGIGSGSISPQPLTPTPASLSPPAPLSPVGSPGTVPPDRLQCDSGTAATTASTIQLHHGQCIFKRHRRSPPPPLLLALLPQPATNNKLCERNELNNNKNGADVNDDATTTTTLIHDDHDDHAENHLCDAPRASFTKRYSGIARTAGIEVTENSDAFVAVNRSTAPVIGTSVAATATSTTTTTTSPSVPPGSVNSALIQSSVAAIDHDGNDQIINNINDTSASDDDGWPSAVLLAAASLREQVQSAKKWHTNNESSEFDENKSVVTATATVAANNNRNSNSCLAFDNSDSDSGVHTHTNPLPFGEDNLVFIGNKAIPVALFNRRIYRRYRRVSLDNPFLLNSGYRESTAVGGHSEKLDNNNSTGLPPENNVSIWEIFFLFFFRFFLVSDFYCCFARNFHPFPK